MIEVFKSLLHHPVQLAWLSMVAGVFFWELIRGPVLERTDRSCCR